MEVKRLDCAHCEQTGTCRTEDGYSCGSCLKDAKPGSESRIVQCSVCLGIGKVEPKTERLIGRVPFLIVFLVLIVFYAYAFFNLGDDTKFNQIFPLVGSLTTMIVTFYFSKK